MRTPLESIYSRLAITPIGHNKWKLYANFTYYRKIKLSKDTIVIPKGFIFDGASIPRIFYIIGTPMSTDTLIGGLVHDYLYRTQTKTRKKSDKIFNEIMLVTDVKFFKRIMYYLGVRIGGWVARRNNKKKLKKSKKNI